MLRVKQNKKPLNIMPIKKNENKTYLDKIKEQVEIIKKKPKYFQK